MAQTELRNINMSIRTGGDNRLGCGATYIVSGTVHTGDWVAIQAVHVDDVVLKVDGTSETVVDWTGVTGDLTLESAAGQGIIWYGNFTQIEVSAGRILAYNRC
jgi:hypothetical protein